MNDQNDHRPSMSLHELHDMALKLMENLAGVVSMPIEYLLRPFHGTLYFNEVQVMLSCIMMMVLAVFGGASHLPGMGAGGGRGLIGLGWLAVLFFAVNLYHRWRCWRLMLHPEREDYAQWEGRPLPFFALLPFGKSFWMVRIIHEPLLVVTGALVLRIIGVVNTQALIFLAVSAVFLCVKNNFAWYYNWRQLRIAMDTRYAGPRFAGYVNGTATEEELVKVHLAGFPKNVTRSVKAAVVSRVGGGLPSSYADMVSPIDKDEAA
jgi:hypothetical protein